MRFWPTKYRIFKDGNGNFQIKYKSPLSLRWRFVEVGWKCYSDLNRHRTEHEPRLFRWLKDAEDYVKDKQQLDKSSYEKARQRCAEKKAERQLKAMGKY